MFHQVFGWNKMIKNILKKHVSLLQCNAFMFQFLNHPHVSLLVHLHFPLLHQLRQNNKYYYKVKIHM